MSLAKWLPIAGGRGGQDDGVTDRIGKPSLLPCGRYGKSMSFNSYSTGNSKIDAGVL